MPVIPHSWTDPFDVCSQEAIVQATMRFPCDEDEEKRKQLACYFDVRFRFAIDEMLPEDKLTVSGRDLILLKWARDIDELGRTYTQMAAGGYYSAHWLRFRLYAAMNCPEMNTNNRWEHYVENDLKHKLPLIWVKNKKTYNSLRTRYAPVAHIWLSWFDEYYRGLNRNTINISVKFLESEDVTRARWRRVFGRAKSYFLAAQAAGLYQGVPGTLRLEDVWQLPDDVEQVPFAPIETPDSWVPDFDAEWYLQEYMHPRA